MDKRQAWETRYATDGYLFGTEPNDFLVEQAEMLPTAGKVLAVADGEGRNGVWLAQRGLHVTSVDFSANALRKAQSLATERGVTIETQQVDVLAWDWPVATFDVVATFFMHPGPEDRKALLALMYRALNPRGLMILEGYARSQADSEFGGPSDPEHCYTVEGLRRSLQGAEILLLQEKTIVRRSGRFPGKPADVVRLLARRPETHHVC